jgi:hypothetical protein
MPAFALAVLLFFYFHLTGLVILRLVGGREQRKSRGILYLASGISISFHTILLASLSRLGVSLADSSPFILVIGTASVLIGLNKMKEIFFHWHTNINIILIISLSILMIWPIFKFSFSWIAFGNGDAAYYENGAKYLLAFPLNGSPDISTFWRAMDYTQPAFHWYSVESYRFGAELLIAFTSLLKGKDTIQIFMPTILILQLSLSAATLGCIQKLSSLSPKRDIFAILLIGISPLMALAVYSQLIAQVGGILLGIVCLFLFSGIYSTLPNIDARDLWLFITAASALVIWYPEIGPYVFVPIFGYLLKKFFQEGVKSRLAIFRAVVIVTSGVLIFAGPNLFRSIKFILNQLVLIQTTDLPQNISSAFPYYLTPNGLPSLLGLSPLNKVEYSFVGNLKIMLAILFFIAIFIAAWKTRIIHDPFGAPAVFMLFAFIYFVYKQNGFASYKIAMFIQPFLIILIFAVFDKWKTKVIKKKLNVWAFISSTIIMVSLLFQITSQQYYTKASTGEAFIGFNEIPKGSTSKLALEIRSTCETYKKSQGVLISTSLNTTISSLIATTCVGVPIIFPTQGFESSWAFGKNSDSPINPQQIDLGKNFSMNSVWLENSISPDSNENRRQYYFEVINQQTILNFTRHKSLNAEWKFQITDKPTAQLLFLNSSLGRARYPAPFSFYSLEKDPLVNNGYMQGLGAVLLFQRIGTEKNPALLLEVSSSLLPLQDRKLPKIQLISSKKSELDVVGNGSARVISQAINFAKIGKREIAQINFLGKPREINVSSARSGLAGLYNSKIKFDSRQVTTFGKRIELIDLRNFFKNYNVKALKNFPMDLSSTDAIYSGIYEDGWASEHFYTMLRSTVGKEIVIRGQIPFLKNQKFFTFASIFINGEYVEARKLGLGDFEIRFPLNPSNSPSQIYKIEVKFEDVQVLPGQDGRPVAALLSEISVD